MSRVLIFLRARVLAFLRARGANVMITVALVIPVLMIGAGASLDLVGYSSARTQLQTAVDAASLAAIAQKSNAYTFASKMLQDGAVPLGVTQATAAFNANSQDFSSLTGVEAKYTVTKQGLSIVAVTTASGVYTPAFSQILGVPTITVNASATATTGLQKFVNFYLAIDVSGSMGLPSTPDEQARLAAINPDDKSLYPKGCTLACHFNGNSGYTLTRNGGDSSNTPVTYCSTPGTSSCIQLRLDAVGYAVNDLLTTAAAQQTFPGQYSVGLYPFIRYLWPTYAPLSSNLTASSSTPGSLAAGALGLATLLDTGVNANLGSGGTHMENALIGTNQNPGLNSLITSVGDGSTSATPAQFVFLITDGSQDNQYYWNGSWGGSNQATTIDASNCTTLKNRGITVGVLYIPYTAISDPTDFAGGEDYAANANIANIPGALASCASPGYFFTASSPTAIDTTLQGMFAQAILSVHLTK